MSGVIEERQWHIHVLTESLVTNIAGQIFPSYTEQIPLPDSSKEIRDCNSNQNVYAGPSLAAKDTEIMLVKQLLQFGSTVRKDRWKTSSYHISQKSDPEYPLQLWNELQYLE